MRLDLPPAFFLGAYVRLAQLGGVGLFVLGAGASLTSPILVPTAPTYGIAQAAVGFVLWIVHLLWERRLPSSEYDSFLRRAQLLLGALAFLAGAAVFIPLAVARAASGASALGETTVGALSLVLVFLFGRGLARELR